MAAPQLGHRMTAPRILRKNSSEQALLVAWQPMIEVTRVIPAFSAFALSLRCLCVVTPAHEQVNDSWPAKLPKGSNAVQRYMSLYVAIYRVINSPSERGRS